MSIVSLFTSSVKQDDWWFISIFMDYYKWKLLLIVWDTVFLIFQYSLFQSSSQTLVGHRLS